MTKPLGNRNFIYLSIKNILLSVEIKAFFKAELKILIDMKHLINYLSRKANIFFNKTDYLPTFTPTLIRYE